MSDTQITQTISSENPADNDTLEGLNDFLQDKMFLHLEKIIPGIVISYDKFTNRAVIKPAITGIATEGTKVPKDEITNIPVLQLGGIFKFPVSAGMTGWLIACDRDISIFKTVLSETAPNTSRKHKYQDGFFIPDVINTTLVTDEVMIDARKDIHFKTGSGNLKINNLTGATGSFMSRDARTIQVTNGLITAII